MTRMAIVRAALLVIGGVLLTWAVLSGGVSAQAGPWSQPRNVSGDGGSWFPDLAVDVSGRAHLVWSTDELRYRGFDGTTWSEVSLLSERIPDVFRSAVAADSRGGLYLFYFDLTEGVGTYRQVAADQAAAGSAWGPRQAIGARGSGYYTALAIESRDRLHAVYIDTAQDKAGESSFADVIYRRSDDSAPPLAPAPVTFRPVQPQPTSTAAPALSTEVPAPLPPAPPGPIRRRLSEAVDANPRLGTGLAILSGGSLALLAVGVALAARRRR